MIIDNSNHKSKRTLMAVAVALALGASAGSHAANDATGKTVQGKEMTEQRMSEQRMQGRGAQRPSYTDEQWQSIAHSSLAVRVQSNLVASESLMGSQIDVTAGEGRKVTLSGKVASKRAKQRAVRVAERTMGVSEVSDKLDVDESLQVSAMGEPVPDQTLAKQVADAIAAKLGEAKVKESWFFGYQVITQSPEGDELKLDVDADSGDIELDGDLARNADVQMVLNVTRSVRGVRSIENNIDTDDYRQLAHAPGSYRAFGYASDAGAPIRGTLMSADGGVQGELVCRMADPSTASTRKQ